MFSSVYRRFFSGGTLSNSEVYEETENGMQFKLEGDEESEFEVLNVKED
jgi:hypothetical protein